MPKYIGVMTLLWTIIVFLVSMYLIRNIEFTFVEGLQPGEDQGAIAGHPGGGGGEVLPVHPPQPLHLFHPHLPSLLPAPTTSLRRNHSSPSSVAGNYQLRTG